MMGQHDRSEALFYFFRLEDQVPETHLLRLIEKHISFAFVRQQLKDSSLGPAKRIDGSSFADSPFLYHLFSTTSSFA